MKLIVWCLVLCAVWMTSTAQIQQGDYFPQGIRVSTTASCSSSSDDGRVGRDTNGGLTLCNHDGNEGVWESYKGEKGADGPVGPKGDRGDDTLTTGVGQFLEATTATYTFFLPGSPSTYYPVYFTDNIGWDDGIFELMIVRPNFHTDAQNHGSLTFVVRSHASYWGHGSTWLETDLSYSTGSGPSRFVASYAMPSTVSGVIVWLAGSTTYGYRSNHQTQPTWADPIEGDIVLRIYNGGPRDVYGPTTTVSSTVTQGRNIHSSLGVSSTLRVGTLDSNIGSYKLYVNGPSFFTDAPQSSDRRLKDTIEPLTAKYQPLETIQRLHGRTFEWRKTPADMHEDEVKEEIVYPEGRQMGLIADEVENVVPEIVADVIQHGRSYRGLRYDKLNALLVEGIKDLSSIVERQRQEIQEFQEMKNTMNTVLARLDVLESKD